MAPFLKRYLPFLSLCLSLTLIIYAVIFFFHSIVPFETRNYRVNAYHFLPDPKARNKPFQFLSSLAQYDAQWYLRIATQGYPTKVHLRSPHDSTHRQGAVFAFFPLYPLLIYITNLFFHNIELSAFILTNLFLLANSLSIYYIIGKISSSTIAIKTAVLLSVFPFSIFLRSYYGENLQLFLLLWFSFFLIKKRMGRAALCLSLLLITKGSFLPFIPFYGYFLWKQRKKEKVALPKIAVYLLLIFLPLMIWMYMNYRYSGNPIYFLSVLALWTGTSSFLPSILSNIGTIAHFLSLPLHDFARSQIEVLTVCLTALLLLKSRKTLPKELWWVSFIVFFTPLVTKDLMSFSRYQSISFPLFFYVSAVLSKKYFLPLSMFLYTLLLITSIYFVNWYWVG